MERKEELLKLGNKCPMAVVQSIVAGKWKLLIIYNLRNEVKRFGELQRALPDIRQSTLTQQLRELEKDGIIHREIYREVPPKVEYSLTEIGRRFLKVTKTMLEWSDEYVGYIKNYSEKNN
ncbi:helix-turn-helix transcriptional regulator [Clostridium felsineum]|uniref:winged helix-turn-helix transcriptional regulator n=1 Tax=Clostridium felsineum TaxID=36839 RepID=UPI00214DC138|nr:helix-turn-helix domain-containing protein [Clostridium felsineum]MCR3761330.1 helix-turn-helix transcriptional regulator [Clostridium felsineum]